ncbi:MAG: hypothetical protein ACI9UA_003632 [Pseudoalteromonas tetraodonis]
MENQLGSLDLSDAADGVVAASSESPQGSPLSGLAHANPPRTKPPENLGQEVQQGALDRREISEEGEIDRRFAPDISSSTVKTFLSETQVLVTGGFPSSDGKHTFSFITPKRHRLDDGTDAILVVERTVELDQDSIAEAGLETLATNARNTIQHAEVWERQDMQATLTLFAKREGVSVTIRPSVIARPSAGFEIEVGGRSFRGSLDFGEAGEGFIVDTRIEHSAETHGAED